MNNQNISVAVVDDHKLLRKGLANLVNSFGGYTVLFEADNGHQFTKQISLSNVPELVLLDINMPEMDGYQTAAWIKTHYPLIKVLALSMYDNENAIIRMIKNGARGYILKDSEPAELKNALDSIIKNDYYYSEIVTGMLIHSINSFDLSEKKMTKYVSLNDREITFLKYACTEMTYKQIADAMNVSPRTVDGYRDALFEKLNVKTRVGLVMYAIRNGIVTAA